MDDAAIRQIKAEGDRGIKAAQAGRPDVAGQHFNAALGHAEEVKDPRTRRDEMAVLSALFDQFGFPDLALTAAEESVDLDRRLGLDALLYEDLLNMGTAHLNLDNDAKAEECFREALKLALAASDWANAASANTNLGNVLSKHGEMTQAIATYEKSLEYLAKEGFANTEMNTRIMLLQASEIANYDVDRSIDNARAVSARFWQELPAQHREALTTFVVKAADRYLKAHPQKDPKAWKSRTFPMIFR